MGLFSRKKNAQPVEVDFDHIPEHIAIIMDGNGRWAKRRGMPRTVGHSAGAETFRTIGNYCKEIGVKYLTVYAFSTENWRRPKEEGYPGCPEKRHPPEISRRSDADQPGIAHAVP